MVAERYEVMMDDRTTFDSRQFIMVLWVAAVAIIIALVVYLGNNSKAKKGIVFACV